MAQVNPEIDFTCLSCSYRSDKEKQFLKHVSVHRFEPNFKIKCRVCPQKLKTKRSYRKHKKTCPGLVHVEERNEKETQSKLNWQCPNCPQVIQINSEQSIEDFQREGGVKKHLYKHSSTKEIVKCPIVTCPNFDQPYNAYSTFNQHINKHIRRKEFVVKTTENIQPLPDHNPNSNEDLVHREPLLVEDVEPNSISDSDSSHSDREHQIDLPVLQEQDNDIYAMNSLIEKTEAIFALKLCSKNLLPQEVVNDVFSFCAQIHEMKLELITKKLNDMYVQDTDLNIQNVTDTVDLIDNATGLGSNLATHYKREKLFRDKFDIIEPIPMLIGKKSGKACFFYYLPISKTLTRLISNDTLRSHIIKQPMFDGTMTSKKVYRTFSDGRLIRNMDIHSAYALLRLFIDAFGSNNPLGSSSGKNKIVGFYYSGINSLKAGSNRSTIQTLAILDQKHIDHFGLSFCLREVMEEVKNLVQHGIYDNKSKKTLQVRVICQLGDNLG